MNRKTYLKGLAETRARADADVARYTKIHAEVTALLADAEATRASCDKLIRKFNVNLDPTAIAPIKAWKGRYGRHGALQAAVRRHIQAAWPEALTTLQLGLLLQMELDLQFPTRSDEYRWYENSLRPAIRKSVRAGLVERVGCSPDKLNVELAHWRWKSDAALSMDHLLAQAEAAGVSVQQADDDPE